MARASMTEGSRKLESQAMEQEVIGWPCEKHLRPESLTSQLPGVPFLSGRCLC